MVPYRICKAMKVKMAAEDGIQVRRDGTGWGAMDGKARVDWLVGGPIGAWFPRNSSPERSVLDTGYGRP